MNKCFLLLTLLTLLVACSGTNPVNNMNMNHNVEQEGGTVETEEYNVYSFLIGEMYNPNPSELVAIEDQTSVDSYIGGGLSGTLQYLSQHISGGIKQEILDDFQAKNDQPHSLKNLFKLQVKYVLVSAQEMHELFQKGYGWDVFFKKYPMSKRLITLSRVGLNHEMDQALIYIGSQSGGKSGAGYYLFLTRENNIWIIKQKIEVWIS